MSSSSLSHDFLGGQYSVDQLAKVVAMNRRKDGTEKPNFAFYQKNMHEHGPTWEDRRELVNYLIHDSNITPASKTYLAECEDWIPRYQLRGFKYGLVSSAAVYFAMPVIR